MKRSIVIGIITLVVILIILFVIWKKESPSPEKTEEKILINTLAFNLYSQKKSEGMQFSSQCLGTIGDYAVDIVHVPRSSEDNLVENQCADFREGKVSHFIELEKDGNVVRIV